jgi:hypothetical protein
MKKYLLLLAILPFIISCNKSIDNFPKLYNENLDGIDFTQINNDHEFGNYSLDWERYKYATTKFIYPKTDTVNHYDINDIINRKDAENLMSDFEKTAKVYIDKRDEAPYYQFDIRAKIETPKRFYRNYRKVWGGSIEPQYRQENDLLYYLDFNFKRDKHTKEIEFPTNSYELRNEKNEKLILHGFHDHNMMVQNMDFEEVQNGKEYNQFRMPNFSLRNDSIQQSFTKLKGYIDLDIEVPYEAGIVTVTNKDVGKTIMLNGIKVDILVFEDNVLHLKIENNPYEDNRNKLAIFSKYIYDSKQYEFSCYQFMRKNPNLKLNDYLSLLSKTDIKSEDFEPYVFVVYFRNKINEVKFIATDKTKIVRKKIRVNIDV